MTSKDIIDGIIKSVASIDQIPQVISVFFDSINKFLSQLQIVFLNVYVLLIIAIFFGLLILTAYGLFKVYPFFAEHKKLLKKLVDLT
jgi:hypothetical protein